MKIFFLALLLGITQLVYGQAGSGKFFVNGDGNKYYPVIFNDYGWVGHQPTEIQIGRSDTHEDANWNGSVMARFRIHTMMWGHGSHFIETNIYQGSQDMVAIIPFVAGYHDATRSSGNRDFIIWLKGQSSYHFTSNVQQSPRVYDNVQNLLPYQEENGPVHTFKTAMDENVNANGMMLSGQLSIQGTGNNYFAGNIGIGTRIPNEKLEVNGKIRAKEIKVEANNWPDYVFKTDYNLRSLTETERFINEHGHLPDVPKAEEVETDGVSLGEMNKILLKKIEEMTLQLIQLNREVKLQSEQVKKQSEKIKLLEKE